MYKRLPNQTDPISQNYMIGSQSHPQEKFIGSLTTSDAEANCAWIHYTDSQSTPTSKTYGFLVPLHAIYDFESKSYRQDVKITCFNKEISHTYSMEAITYSGLDILKQFGPSTAAWDFAIIQVNGSPQNDLGEGLQLNQTDPSSTLTGEKQANICISGPKLVHHSTKGNLYTRDYENIEQKSEVSPYDPSLSSHSLIGFEPSIDTQPGVSGMVEIKEDTIDAFYFQNGESIKSSDILRHIEHLDTSSDEIISKTIDEEILKALLSLIEFRIKKKGDDLINNISKGLEELLKLFKIEPSKRFQTLAKDIDIQRPNFTVEEAEGEDTNQIAYGKILEQLRTQAIKINEHLKQEETAIVDDLLYKFLKTLNKLPDISIDKRVLNQLKEEKKDPSKLLRAKDSIINETWYLIRMGVLKATQELTHS